MVGPFYGKKKKKVGENSNMLALKNKRLKIQENKGISDGAKSLKKAEQNGPWS